MAGSVSFLAGGERVIIGLDRNRTLIEGTSIPASDPDSPSVLLIGGLDGEGASSRMVQSEVGNWERLPPSDRRFRLTAISVANPGRAQLVFPPAGQAYRDHPESHALWRWIGVHAPDLVLIAGENDFGLAAALPENAVAAMGRIPARRVAVRPGLLAALPKHIPHSEARAEIERRLARSPREVAESLSRIYGQELPEAVYIPAFALIGRLRLGQIAEVRKIVAPYLDGSRDSLAKATGSHLAGHLVFADLAERTGDARCLELVRKVALLGFTPAGEMRDSMPMHSEMSDSVFMGCPILAKAGKLTHDPRYFDLAARHLRFMQRLCLRRDGIYRHSPLHETAWGRGNAFPALGLALTLSDFPPDHPVFPEILLAFREHMDALARFQDENGMWRQVIDLPGAYPEFSATAMITAAMTRGIRRGWLDAASYQPRVDRAWRAVNARIASDGVLMDVCESTGKQRSLEDYLRRAAILDRDPRGGGMALVVSTEMAGLP